MARAGEERALEEKAESIGVDIPIELQADRVPPQLLGLNSYDKPSVGLQLLREEILGPDAFDDALPRVHPAVGIQAPSAGGFLPHDGRCWRPSARLVLA